MRTLTVAACCLTVFCVGVGAGAAEKAEDIDNFAKWLAIDKDPILCRLKITAEQREKLGELHTDLAQQKAEIIAKYKDVRMAMARRGMYREIMALEAGAEAEFPKVLSAEQRRKMAVGEKLVAACHVQVEKIKTALSEREAWARSNPSGYADFKKRCDSAIKGWVGDRDRKLDELVGKKAKPGSEVAKTVKVIKLDERGVYRSGKWEYRLRVGKKAGKVVYRSGSLTRDGKGQHMVKPGTVVETPWGKMKKQPVAAEEKGDQGWIPVKK